MDEINDLAKSHVAETHFNNYLEFMNKFQTQLSGIEGALGCSTNNDKHLHPIVIQTKAEEKISFVDIITTDNKVLNKVLITLSALCNEVFLLEDEAKTSFYNQLLFYGETGKLDVENGGKISETYVKVSKILPTLQNLLCFVHRCREVLKNSIQQMAALYNKTLPKVIDVSQVHFSIIFEKIAHLLKVLHTIDEIVANNSILQTHWNIYKGMIKSIELNPSSFEVTKDKLEHLKKLVKKVDTLVISSRLFYHCIDQDFDDSGIPVSKNSVFIEEFMTNIKFLFNKLEVKLGDNVCEFVHAQEFVAICCLFVFNSRLFHDIDKKFFNKIWDVNKKLPCVVLFGPVTWLIENFFMDNLPNEQVGIITNRMKDQCESNRANWLNTKVSQLNREFQHYFFSINKWLVKMTASCEVISENTSAAAVLTERSKTYFEGISLGGRLQRLTSCLLNLHIILSRPMSKQLVLLICKFVSLIKSVQDCFYRHTKHVAFNSQHVVQRIQFNILNSMLAVKKKLVSDKRYSSRRLDMLSALVLFCNNINNVPTTQRLLVASLSLTIANQSRLMRDEEYLVVHSQMWQLDTLSQLLNRADGSCQQGHLYWHRSILPTYFANLHTSSLDVTDLQFMMSALEDCAPYLKLAVHLENSTTLYKSYRDDTVEMFKENFLEKLFKNVENDLRLSVHTHLKLDDRNPFNVGVKPLNQSLSLKPIRFMGIILDIKGMVTHYLDQTFYNLTTVALHDWKTYSKMRKVATDKYNLKMQQVHLPNQQLEQGLDVLNIMKSIDVFTSTYRYSLSNQLFVEKQSNNKHLNTINIQHIANSIRTHGSGIINTTINYTYQLLKQRFRIFSQFLIDDQVKSPMMRDRTYFKENRDRLNHQFPYERAEGLVKQLIIGRKNYISLFRELITQMGNAMGFVRIMRNGGLHYSSDAISFVPDVEEIVNFEELAKADDISEEINSSFSQFDVIVKRLVKQLGGGGDLFSKLVKTFAPILRGEQHKHCRYFYLIVPALTINFVENIIISKEKMNKKNKEGAAFTDDGFAMGLAYLLEVMGSNSRFDSLHWFDSVKSKYNHDKQRQHAEMNSKTSSYSESESLQQTRILALKRIEIYDREFDLLKFSLRSARIFFQNDEKQKTEEKSENKKEAEKEDEEKTAKPEA